jgi:hypothetical protein
VEHSATDLFDTASSCGITAATFFAGCTTSRFIDGNSTTTGGGLLCEKSFSEVESEKAVPKNCRLESLTGC